MKMYYGFDTLPHSDQFAIKELFPELEIEDVDKIKWIFCGYGNDQYELISELVFDLIGNDNDVIAMIDETSPDRNASWVYGLIYHEET